ncbi:MAG: TolC family protein [Alphaproteobacteria bacterium]|nr:TolC family protein [Alphaproteobacteria bacterium]
MYIKFRSIIGLMCLLVSVNAHAVNLDAVLERVLTTPLGMRVVADETGEYISAQDKKNWENPELEYEYDLRGNSGEFSIEQEIRPSDITGARFRYARTVEEQLEQKKQTAFLRASHQAERLYMNVYMAQKKAEFAKQKVLFLEKAQKVTEGSMPSLEMTMAEKLAFDADVELAKQEEKQTLKKLEIQKQNWALAMGKSFPNEDFEEPVFLKKVPAEAQVLGQNMKNAEEAQIKLSEKALGQKESFTRQDALFPSLKPKVAYAPRESETALTLALSLPIFDRKSGQLEAIKLEKEALRAQMRTYENVPLIDRIRLAYQEMKGLYESLQMFQTKILPAYEESMRKTDDRFLNGQITILDVWDMRSKQMDVEAQYLDFLSDFLDAKITLEQVIGIRLKEI